MKEPEEKRGRREFDEAELAHVDRLLDAVPRATTPRGLAERVLAAADRERALEEGRLDAVLDRLEVGAAPEGLTERVLRATAEARGAVSDGVLSEGGVAPGATRLRLVWMAPVAAAAGILVAVSLGLFDRENGGGEPDSITVAVADPRPAGTAPNPSVDPPDGANQPGVGPLPVDRELLEDLEVLEEWELLMDEELELLLADLEEVDEWLVLLPEDENG